MPGMICQGCGTQIPQGAGFCPGCGKKIAAQVCQACGAQVPEGSRFCQNCGKEVGGRVCQNCGTKMVEGAQFCQNCGQGIVAAPRLEQPAQAPVVAAQKRPKMRWQYRLAIVLPILIALVIFIFYTLNNQNQTTPVTTVPVTTFITTKTTIPPTTIPTTTATIKTTSLTTTITTSTTTGKTLSEIMGLAANIATIKYDMTLTTTGTPATAMKVWMKKNKMRMEIPSQGAVMLLDGDAKTMYMYLPAQNMAIKMAYDPSQMPNSAQDSASTIMNSNPKVIGTETFDGKTCSVVTYSQSGASVKSWIWQDKGIVLRTEMTSSQGTTILELKNIDFSDIPDSMFVLPSGVNVTSS